MGLMTKRLPKQYLNCFECKEVLKGKSLQKFCCTICANSYRRKQKYGETYRSKDARTFMRRLLDKKRRVGSELTIDFLDRLYQKQLGKCALSGREMTFIAGKGRVSTNISIDQIIPSLGYTQDNVQLVCAFANILKGSLMMDELYLFCEEILKNRKED